MPWTSNPVRRTWPLSRLLATAVIAMGCLALLGWLLDVPTLKSLYPGWVSVKPNTAVGLLLAAVALFLGTGPEPGRAWRRAATLCATGALALGALTLLEHFFGVDLGIDELLFREPPSAPRTPTPGRMAPLTAANLVLLAVALLLLPLRTRRGRRTSYSLALLAALSAFLAAVGYLYGVPGLYGQSQYTAMALPTALAFLMLSAGILFAHPGEGPMAVVSSEGLGGRMVRRLLPATLLIPIVLGYLRLVADRLGMSVPIGVALLITSVSLLSGAIVWWNALALDRADAARQRATDELRAETWALDLERRRLLALVEQMPAGVVLAEAPSGRLILANEQVAQIWRQPFRPSRGIAEYSEWVGFHPEDGQRMAPGEWALARAIKEGETVSQEVEILRGDGTHGFILNRGAPIRDASGRVVGGVVSFVDITPLKEALRAREEILAIVSHDLRNPLSVISLHEQALTRIAEVAEGGGPRIRDHAETILRSARRMERLISDLLDFASIETGRLALSLAPQAPAALAQEACALFESFARDGDLRLTCAAGGDLPQVRCDHDRVLQVLSNLLDNALKMTPRGGTVAVRAESRPGEVCFAVTDSGPGIPADELLVVFDRFRRGRGAGYKGTGLGLAIARGVVTGHGGRLWVESQVGTGSTFYFTLPVA